MLYATEEHTIGKHRTEVANIRITPEVKVRVDQEIDKRLWLIPISYKDKIDHNIVYEKVTNQNVDKVTPLVSS